MVHHQTVGNLDKRGTGDVTTLTVEEYSKLKKRQQFRYRFYRNPIFLFGVAPILLFTAFESLNLRLWDDKRKMMIRFSEI